MRDDCLVFKNVSCNESLVFKNIPDVTKLTGSPVCCYSGLSTSRKLIRERIEAEDFIVALMREFCESIWDLGLAVLRLLFLLD